MATTTTTPNYGNAALYGGLAGGAGWAAAHFMKVKTKKHGNIIFGALIALPLIVGAYVGYNS